MRNPVIISSGVIFILILGVIAFLFSKVPQGKNTLQCHGGATFLSHDASQPSFRGTFTFHADSQDKLYIVINGAVLAGGEQYTINRMREFDYSHFQGGTYKIRAKHFFRYEQDNYAGKVLGAALPELLFSERADGTVTMVDVDPILEPTGYLITDSAENHLLCTDN